MLGKKRVRENPRVPEGAAAARQSEENKGANGGGDEQLAGRKGGAATPAPEKAHSLPRSHRELGEAIFDEADPVKAGRELLEPGEGRGDPTRLNSLKAFADWAYGKQDAEGYRKPPRIIWDIPGPPYEPVDPEAEELEGGEK